MAFSLTDDYLAQLELEQASTSPSGSRTRPTISDSLAQLELETAGQTPGGAPSTTFFPSLGGNAQQVAAQIAGRGYPMQDTPSWISGADAAAFLGMQSYDPNMLYQRPWDPSGAPIPLETLFNQMVRDAITSQRTGPTSLVGGNPLGVQERSPTGIAPSGPFSLTAPIAVPSGTNRVPVGETAPPAIPGVPFAGQYNGSLGVPTPSNRGPLAGFGDVLGAGLNAMDVGREHFGNPLAGGIANAVTDPSLASTIGAVTSAFGGPLQMAIGAGMANLGTDYQGSKQRGEEIRSDIYNVPGVGTGLGAAYDVLTDPLTYVGIGAAGALAKKAPALSPLLAGKYNPVGGLLEGVGPQRVLPLAIGAGAGAQLAESTNTPFVPEAAERFGFPLIGGLAGLGASGVASRPRLAGATPPSASATVPSPELGRVVIGGAMPPTQSRSAMRNLADVPMQATTRLMTFGMDPTPALLAGVAKVPNEPVLGMFEALPPEQASWVRRFFPNPDDPQVRPIMQERARGIAVTESQAVALRAKAQAVESQFKWVNVKKNHFVRLLDGSSEDIRDVAARLPEFETKGLITPAQAQAIRDLGAELNKFADLSAYYGKPIGTRADVQEGGVYLPRGKPTEDGVAGIVEASGPARRGGRAGPERSAIFDSVRTGVSNGEIYPRLSDAVYNYAHGLGRANAERATADTLSKLRDADGKLMISTPKELVDQRLRAQYEDLGREVVNVRNRLRTAEKRAKIAGAQADELDTAIERVEVGIPETGTRGVARTRTVMGQEAGRAENLLTERFGRPAGSEPVRIKMPVELSRRLRGEEIQRVLDRFEEIVPPDVDKLRQLDTAVNNSYRRINTLRARGGHWANVADGLSRDLDRLGGDLKEVGDRYRAALDSVGRGRGSIQGLAPLSGSTFPDKIANTANRYLNQTARLQGRGSGVYRGLEAVKDATFPIRLGIDIGYAGIHGLIPAAVDKAAWAASARASAEAFFGRPALGGTLQYIDDLHARLGLPRTTDMARNGLAFSGSGARSAGVSFGSVGETIRSLPPVKQFDRAYGTFVDNWRALAASNKLQTAKALGLDISDDAVQRDIYRVINQVSGYGSKPFLGEWGQFFLTAPRMYQGDFELLGAALKNGDISGAIARDAMLRTIGQVVMTTEAINRLNGYDTEYGVDVSFEDGRPKVSFPPDWLAIKDIDGNDVKLLGRYDSLARVATATLHGDLTYGLETKAAPGISILRDLIRGEDFYGRDYNLNSGEGLKNFARSLLPLPAQTLEETGSLTAALLDLHGLKSRQASFYTKLTRQYFDETGRDYTSDKKIEPRKVYEWMKGHPELEAEEKTYLDEMIARGQDWAVSVKSADDARAAFNANQSARDAELLQGGYPEEWRSLRSDDLKYLRGRTDEIWKDYVPPEDGQPQLLKDYFAAIEAGRELTGAWDSAPLEAFMASLNETDQKWIEDNTGLSRELTPVEQRYRAEVRIIADSGYWSYPDEIARRFAADVGFPATIQSRADLYDYVENEIGKRMRAEGQDPTTLDGRTARDEWVASVLSYYTDWVSNVREDMRYQLVDSPYADGGKVQLWELLVKWGYKEPSEDEREFLRQHGDRTGGYQ
jgi:hypothetical protein